MSVGAIRSQPPLVRVLTIRILAVLALLPSCGAENAEWQIGDPDQLGFDGARLEQAAEELESRGTQGFLVIRKDQIVYEWYRPGAGPESRHYTASVAKSIVGGLALLVALNDERLEVDERASMYIPAWREVAPKSEITIRQLATHSSGLEDAEEGGIPHAELTGWKGAFWKREEEQDPFSISVHDVPVLFPPGSSWEYSNPGLAALGYALTASFEGSAWPDLRTLLHERIFSKIGISDEDLEIGYGETAEVDGLPLVAAWGGGRATPRALARVGRLMLQRGNWEGRQLLKPGLVDQAVAYAGTPLPPRTADNPAPASGLGWYTNFDGVWAMIPKDAFAAAGAQHQLLLVVPSLDLIVVRMGASLSDRPERFWGDALRFVFDPVIAALNEIPPRPFEGGALDPPPLPSSEVFGAVEFAPKEQIVRRASGSDNWPLTWAEGGELYTVYGDGWGFEPGTEEKLSLGLARVFGDPEDFRGANLRAPTLEQLGQGASGRKGSGILAVGRSLYVWARNAGNSQLASSDDGGKSWMWSDWRFTESFGHPTFLQFGRGYRGARDAFVYVYSHDSDSAYEAADRMVLARVPKERVQDRESYEFFSGMDGHEPKWTKGIGSRAAVFSNPGGCFRSSVSYHAPSGRYLWVQILPSEAPRFHGGFGIYEAPEPWGPWRTVFYTENWDVGPGENAHLPTKWMSPDGSTLHLVFSGDDYFSVRKLVLQRARVNR